MSREAGTALVIGVILLVTTMLLSYFFSDNKLLAWAVMMMTWEWGAGYRAAERDRRWR